MSHYTEADVQAAVGALTARGPWRPALLAKDVLDAAAPAIAAQALRDAAEWCATFTRPDSGLIPKDFVDGFMEALDGVSELLRKRADEIERGAR